MTKAKLTLINITGPDHPGITARLMQCLEEENIELHDIGQSVTYGLLSLSFIISVPNDSSVVKDLLFQATEMGMKLEYREVEKLGKAPHLEAYIISCISPSTITPKFMKEFSSLLAQNKINIKRIDNLNPKAFSSIDFQIEVATNQSDLDKIKQGLLSLSHSHALDLALLKDNVWRRNKRLIVFDMDSTLIQSEVIVEMAKVHGVGEKVHDITERAMNGELNFDQSLTERVSLLEGLNVDKLDEILRDIKLTDGVEKFLETIQKLGYKTAIISGGFLHFAKHFQKRLGIDYAFANDLMVDSGKLTGKIKGEIINAKQKAILLEMLAQQEGINLEQVVAIGDGANDLPMLAKAGLGIAFHAKEVVKKEASQHMSFGNMDSILHFLGIPGEV